MPSSKPQMGQPHKDVPPTSLPMLGADYAGVQRISSLALRMLIIASHKINSKRKLTPIND